jgi:hypothetical protein
MAYRLRWLGNVLRMGDERCPKQVLLSKLHGVKARRGHPLLSWEACVHQDLLDLDLPTSMQELKAMCAQRGAWRSMLYKLTHRDCGFAPDQHASVKAQQEAARDAAAAANRPSVRCPRSCTLMRHVVYG